MKKMFILATGLLLTVLSVTLFAGKTQDVEKSLLMRNVEAIARGEDGDGGGGSLWTREDKDCTYNFTGRAGAEVNVSIAGLGAITLRLDAEGSATYTYGDGQTRCFSGGNEQCTARYCPPITGVVGG